MPDCVDMLQGRTAGGGKKIEPNIDKCKCSHSVRVQNISVLGGCSNKKKWKTMGMARFDS